MTYYRIAFQVGQSNTWQWESRVIGSLDLVFRVLSLHRTMSWDRIRVFFASSVADLDEMLAHENTGMLSSSLTADQLFDGSAPIPLCELNQCESERGSTRGMGMAVTVILREQAQYEQRLSVAFKEGRSFLEMRRLTLELGAIRDHDTAYVFTCPTTTLQLIAWTKLLTRVRSGELEP